MSNRLYLFGGPAKSVSAEFNEAFAKLLRADASIGYMRWKMLILESYLIRPGTVMFRGSVPANPKEHHTVVPKELGKAPLALFGLDASRDGTAMTALLSDPDPLVRKEILRGALSILRQHFSMVGVMLDYLSSESPYTAVTESLDDYVARREQDKLQVFAIIRGDESDAKADIARTET